MIILCLPFSSFPMSQFFISVAQSIGVSASASVLPMNIQGWFLLGLTGLISLLSKELSRVFSNTTSSKASILLCSAFLISSSHIHTWPLEKPQLWLHRPLLVMSCLCFLISVLVGHSFTSKEQASFNFMAAVTLCSDFGAQENKVSLFPLFPHLFAMKWWDDGSGYHDLSFLNVEL